MMETCKEDLAACLVSVLTQKKLHISAAESCTGGMIASDLISISGASSIIEESYVTYSNRVKQKLLGVKSETLQQYTVVSEEVAAEMAEGMAKATSSEITLSATGYAGPDPGEDGTEAGTVCLGCCYQGKVSTKKFVFSGNRQQVRAKAVEEAYRMALERLGSIE